MERRFWLKSPGVDPRWVGLWQQDLLPKPLWRRVAAHATEFEAIIERTVDELEGLPGAWSRCASAAEVIAEGQRGLEHFERVVARLPAGLEVRAERELSWETASAFVVTRGALHERACALAVVGTRGVGGAVSARIEAWMERSLPGCLALVSGGASGVDAIAHRAALTAGVPTWAVFAGGLDKPGPVSNMRTFEEMLEAGGGWISERRMGISLQPYDFITRNKVIARASAALLMARAPARSGALSTVRFAVQERLPVGVLPSAFDEGEATGNQELLREGVVPIFCAEDLRSLAPSCFGRSVCGELFSVQELAGDAPALTPPLDDATIRQWLAYLAWEQAPDTKIGGGYGTHLEAILDLELAGLVRVLPGGDCALTERGRRFKSESALQNASPPSEGSETRPDPKENDVEGNDCRRRDGGLGSSASARSPRD